MKRILVLISVLLVALATWRLFESQASLGVTSSTRISVASASLNFNLNGDENSSTEIDLGKVIPGDSGAVTVTVNNVGTISGTLCVERETVPPKFILQPAGTCEVVIEPGSLIRFDLEWSLPISAHNTGMDGTNFKFVINIRFENGFKVTKQVILIGIINDPVDTPTATPTTTPTYTVTYALTHPYLLATDSLVPTIVDTVTNTPTSTCTPTDIPIILPTETPTPTETLTEIPTETSAPPTETPVILDSETSTPTG
jgi:hypothetical protein